MSLSNYQSYHLGKELKRHYMQCTQCNSRQAKRGTLCEECVEGNRRRLEQRDADWNFQKNVRQSRRASLFQLIDARWLQGAFVLVILFFLFGERLSLWPQHLARTELVPFAAASSDPCAGKTQCVVVVVAPWCPSCHGAIGFLRTLRNYATRRGDLGVQIIISKDKLPQLEAMASEIGGPVYLNPANTIKVSAVPSWWVINQQGTVLARGTGLPGISEEGPPFFMYLESYMKL